MQDDAPLPQEDAALPQAVVRTPRRRRLSLVWLLPLVVGLAGIWLVVQAVLNEGPTVTVRFASAEGIEPGKTKIRFKDVDIGEVKAVSVSKDRRHVIVRAKLARDANDFLLEDTRFWVVRPRIAAGSVSGLGTLLSGAYIGVDVGHSDKPQREFEGLDVPPILTGDRPGRTFVLHAAEIGSLDVGAPLSFRHIPVGQVVAFQLDPDGKAVTLKAFVNAPYDQYVTANTRFWHASGVDLTLDASGLRLETQSLASLIEGGIAFQAPPDSPAGAPAASDASFILYPDRDKAMRLPDQEQALYVSYFTESLRGLSPGAPVDFHGIAVGEVQSVGVEYLPAQGIFRFPVQYVIYPGRMRARYVAGAAQPARGEAARRALVNRLVESGMRAQLRNGNLLTGQMFVALDFFGDARKAGVDWAHSPPVLPSTGGGLGEVQDSVASILRKVDRLPLADLTAGLQGSVQSLQRTLDDTDRLILQVNGELAPEARALLGDARGTLGAAQKTLGSAELTLGAARQNLAGDAPLQLDLRDALHQLARSAQALGGLADYLERHPEALIRGRSAPREADTAGRRP